MNKVEITRPMVGICHMQVCAENDANDEEILTVCNRENPAGTSNGWSRVIREPAGTDWEPDTYAPEKCEDHEGRKHFLVVC